MPTVVSNADIIIGPNGRQWGGPINLNGGLWGYSIIGDSNTNIHMAEMPREGATVEALQTMIETYPERVGSQMNGLMDEVRDGKRGIDWNIDKSLDQALNSHSQIIDHFLIEDWGLEPTEAQKLSKKYIRAIQAAAEQADDPVVAARDSRAGIQVLEDYAHTQIEPLIKNPAQLETMIAIRPIHSQIFALDLNGNVVQGERPNGAYASLWTTQNLQNPVSASDLASSIDDLRYFSNDVAKDTVSRFNGRLANAASIDEARGVHRELAAAVANDLAIDPAQRGQFVDAYMQRLTDQPLATLQDGTVAKTNIAAGIEEKIANIPHTTEEMIVRVRTVSDAYYATIDAQAKFVRQEVAGIAAEMGLPNTVDTIRIELAQGGFAFGGGTVGAEAHTSRGAIRISDSMLSLLDSGTMKPEEFRRNIREEIRHTVDLRNGVSDQPKWQTFVDDIYNDPARQNAWAEFARSKGKSPPEYYKKYGGLAAEFTADLADMRQEWSAAIGPDAAHARIAEKFGPEALELLNEFDEAARMTEQNARMAALQTKPSLQPVAEIAGTGEGLPHAAHPTTMHTAHSPTKLSGPESLSDNTTMRAPDAANSNLDYQLGHAEGTSALKPEVADAPATTPAKPRTAARMKAAKPGVAASTIESVTEGSSFMSGLHGDVVGAAKAAQAAVQTAPWLANHAAPPANDPLGLGRPHDSYISLSDAPHARGLTAEKIAATAMKDFSEADRAALRAAAVSGDMKIFGRLGKGLGGKIPLIGAGIAGAFAAYTVIRAEQAHAQGILNDDQYGGILAMSSIYTATQVGSIFTGIAGEEGVEATLRGLNVPKEYRYGTIRTAIVDMFLSGQAKAEAMAAIPQDEVYQVTQLVNDPSIVDLNKVSNETPSELYNGLINELRVIQARKDDPVDFEGNVYDAAYETDHAIREYLYMGGSKAEVNVLSRGAPFEVSDQTMAEIQSLMLTLDMDGYSNPASKDGKVDRVELGHYLYANGRTAWVDADKNYTATADELREALTKQITGECEQEPTFNLTPQPTPNKLDISLVTQFKK